MLVSVGIRLETSPISHPVLDSVLQQNAARCVCVNYTPADPREPVLAVRLCTYSVSCAFPFSRCFPLAAGPSRKKSRPTGKRKCASIAKQVIGLPHCVCWSGKSRGLLPI